MFVMMRYILYDIYYYIIYVLNYYIIIKIYLFLSVTILKAVCKERGQRLVKLTQGWKVMRYL